MKSFEFTAKTIEQAIEKGLAELGKKQEDVDIQILSEGGFFKKAKVVISFDDEVLKTNFAKPQPKEDPKAEQKPEEKHEHKQEVKREEKLQDHNVIDKVLKEEKPQEKKPAEQPNAKVEEKEHKKEKHNNAPKTQEEIEEKQRKFAETHFENNKTSVEFVDGLLKVMNVTGAVSLEEKRDASQILIETEDAGKVIGHRGEGLSAIQYLSNIIETANNKNAKRVVVDAGDYKQRREESLRALAIKVAGKVEATGRPYKLDPMNAFERRIVHTELHNYYSVETHSEGVEPFRRIIVTKK